MGTAIGFTGVGILLVAFVLNLVGALKADGVPYLSLNLAGAALAGLSSWLIDFMPFVLLEGVWAAVTLFALVRVLGGKPMPGAS